MAKNYLSYINENNEVSEFEVGNIVKYRVYNNILKVSNVRIGRIISIVQEMKNWREITSREVSGFYNINIRIQNFNSTLTILLSEENLKHKLIKKWNNEEEYKKSLRKVSEVDPFGEENWDDDVNENNKDQRWVSLFDYINEDQRKDLMVRIHTYKYVQCIANNISVKNYLIRILNNKRVKVTINSIDVEYENITIESDFPELLFLEKKLNVPIKTIRTMDFCENPNSFFKIYVQKRVFNEMDPFGEEDWDDDVNENNENISEFEIGNIVKYKMLDEIRFAEIVDITKKLKPAIEITTGHIDGFYNTYIQMKNLYVKNSWSTFSIRSMKHFLIKKWNNKEEYYNSNRKVSEVDPFGEENWEDDVNESNEMKDERWVSLFDYISEDKKRILMGRILNYKYEPCMENNISVKNYLNMILQDKRVKVTINSIDIEYENMAIESNYPRMSFYERRVNVPMSGKTIRTIDFCENPNNFFKIYIKKRVFNEMDPFGEEDWED